MNLIKYFCKVNVPINQRYMSFTNKDFIFRQLFESISSTYTYILADNASKQAVLIDPVIETVERDANIINEMGLDLRFIMNTHVHADHVTGSGLLKGMLKDSKSVISTYSGAKADIHISEGDEVHFGQFTLLCRHTPGHTSGCMTYILHDLSMAFTGDALLIRGCGRTDFQQGNAGQLYDGVHEKILSLPDHYLLYPAHDYKGRTCTSVWEENEFNPRLSKTRKEFISIMDNLNLPYPKQIDKSLPANLVCGITD